MNQTYSITKKHIMQIVNEQDELFKAMILEYVQKNVKEFGHKAEVLFVDEEKVKRVIQLGLAEYLRIERSGDDGKIERET